MFKSLSSEDMKNALLIKKSHFQEEIPWYGKIQNLVTVEAGWFLMILQKFKSCQVIATSSVQDSWIYQHLKILAIQMNFWLILLDGTTRKQTIILTQLNFLTDLNQLLHSLPKPEEVNNTYRISLNNVLPWIMFPLEQCPLFWKSLVHKNGTLFKFLDFWNC